MRNLLKSMFYLIILWEMLYLLILVVILCMQEIHIIFFFKSLFKTFWNPISFIFYFWFSKFDWPYIPSFNVYFEVCIMYKVLFLIAALYLGRKYMCTFLNADFHDFLEFILWRLQTIYILVLQLAVFVSKLISFCCVYKYFSY